MRVPVGSSGWYLCEWSDEPDDEYIQFRGSKTLALQWANQFRGDSFATSALRDLLGRTFPPLSDDEVAEAVAARLTGGRWLARRPGVKEPPTILERVPEAAEAYPSEGRRAASPPASRSSAPAPDPPVFPDDIDPAAIAAAQKEAAALGLPFCEECLKAQLMAAS